jgi:L-ornithine N5-monooxygenase
MAPGVLSGSPGYNYASDSSPTSPMGSSDGSVSSMLGQAARISRFSRILQGADAAEVHDLVCVGFGPASLAIAVALHDSLRAQGKSEGDIGIPKIRFLERQATFKWHAGMLLPGAKMQISFIKDLATLRDPTSHFTFLNYLKEHDRLVQFSNLGTFLPSRLEFDDYLQWAAGHFEDVVEYSQDVRSIRPQKVGEGFKYDCFEIVSENISTGAVSRLLSRNVVIAVGGRPAKPAMFPAYHDRVMHSSEYNTRIDKLLDNKDGAYRIAIVGGGQSAAEVFSNLNSRFPRATTKLIFRDTALRPSDDSPFVNEVFNPEAVDTFFHQPGDFRSANLKRNKATNYSVVRLELIERIYDELYLQSIKNPDKSQWQHQILPSREILRVVDNGPREPIDLLLKDLDPLSKDRQELLSFDAVIVATGYRRDAHVDMLRDCQVINGTDAGGWKAERDYGLLLDRSAVELEAGLWLQGCNEDTHGLSDTLLSILSTRSGELVESIFQSKLSHYSH